VIAYPNGTWDIEIELPKEVQADLQIANSRAELVSA
jgi:hypothetical protein